MTPKTTSPEPVEQAFLNAPEGEPLSDEERRLLAEARANFAKTGRTRSAEQIRETIEKMRRTQEGG